MFNGAVAMYQEQAGLAPMVGGSFGGATDVMNEPTFGDGAYYAFENTGVGQVEFAGRAGEAGRTGGVRTIRLRHVLAYVILVFIWFKFFSEPSVEPVPHASPNQPRRLLTLPSVDLQGKLSQQGATTSPCLFCFLQDLGTFEGHDSFRWGSYGCEVAFAAGAVPPPGDFKWSFQSGSTFTFGPGLVSQFNCSNCSRIHNQRAVMVHDGRLYAGDCGRVGKCDCVGSGSSYGSGAISLPTVGVEIINRALQEGGDPALVLPESDDFPPVNLESGGSSSDHGDGDGSDDDDGWSVISGHEGEDEKKSKKEVSHLPKAPKGFQPSGACRAFQGTSCFCKVFSDVQQFHLTLVEGAPSPVFDCGLLQGYSLVDVGYFKLDGLHLAIATTERGMTKKCAALNEDAEVGMPTTPFPTGVTTTNPYAKVHSGDCVLDAQCVSCLANPSACQSDTYISCQLQYQYCSSQHLQSGLPTLVNGVTVIIFILGVMAAAGRPSERCVSALPMMVPYAAMNDLVRLAAFGVVSVLVVLSLFIVELSKPEGILLISNPLGSATPMGYFASYLNFSLVMLGVFWIVGLFSFILGFAGTLGAAPPVARDPTIIVAAAVLVMVREVARAWAASALSAQN